MSYDLVLFPEEEESLRLKLVELSKTLFDGNIPSVRVAINSRVIFYDISLDQSVWLTSLLKLKREIDAMTVTAVEFPSLETERKFKLRASPQYFSLRGVGSGYSTLSVSIQLKEVD